MGAAQVVAKPRYERRSADAIRVVVGLAVVGLGMLAVRDGDVSGPEESPSAFVPSAGAVRAVGSAAGGGASAG